MKYLRFFASYEPLKVSISGRLSTANHTRFSVKKPVFAWITRWSVRPDPFPLAHRP